MKDVQAWPRFAGPGHLLELEEDRPLVELVRSWNFRPGIDFQDNIVKKFRCSVHHPSSSPVGGFHLLAVFRRYSFRLTEASVSLALHSCLGGTPSGFHVQFLADRHFRFTVANKAVGLEVADLRRVISPHFDVYLHLLRDGGDHWERELSRWQHEEAASWTVVSSRRRKKHQRRVTFCRNIVQESPKKKSSPIELNVVIKIGEIFCPLNPAQKRKQFQHPNFEIHNCKKDISVDTLFKRLKSTVGVFTSQHSRLQTTGQLACSRCLAPGHLVSDYRNQLRCWFCARYGHKRRSCL